MAEAPSLHVGCMPFPTPQGTQAAVAAMLGALHAAGKPAHLLTYAGGTGAAVPPHVAHRLSDFPRQRSLRSGPSPEKIVLDLRMVSALRRTAATLGPAAVVAHNVEAALVARASAVGPRIYFAHTRFETELPFYGPPAAAGALARLGQRLDAAASSSAHAVVAIAPSLAGQLRAAHGCEATALPPPWSVPTPQTPAEREAARAEVGIAPGSEVALYAGNLDRYQGWEDVLDAVHALPGVRLLVATESALPSEVRRHPATTEGRVRRVPLATETDRRRAHAAADVALIPRRAPGGLPIKLLDALARGLPTVVTRRGSAGLDLEGAAVVVADDDPAALAAGFEQALGRRTELGPSAVAYVARAHGEEAFVRGLEAAIDRAGAAT